MIIWVASYPRSGNTLTRTVLRQCFGAQNQIPPNKMLVEDARTAPETWFVKTHATDIPETDKAICVVRDGRAAISSYRRFIRDVEKRETTLERVINGRPKCWSAHAMWSLSRDPSCTLLLRYESLVHPNDATLAEIAAFVGMPKIKAYNNRFATLHAQDPVQFGVGHNGVGVDEIERERSELFWTRHGDAMRALGYSDTGVPHQMDADCIANGG